MDERLPFSDITNSLHYPSRVGRVYGKQKGTSYRTRKVHQQIFGCDEGNLVSEFENLDIQRRGSSEPKEPQLGQETTKAISPTPASIPENHLTTSSCTRVNPGDDQDKSHVEKLKRPHTVSQALLKSRLEILLSQDSVEKGIKSFEKVFHRLAKVYDFVKLGEGSFADAYKAIQKDVCSSTTSSSRDEPVLKIIPFTVDPLNEEKNAHMTHVDSIAREVRILSRVRPLHGFAHCRSVSIVRGKWPQALDKAFVQFQENRPDDAINEHPATLYGSKQLYAVIEMDDAGQELAQLTRPSAYEAYDAFWTTVILLANAEKKLEFEHRDLHMSNICFKRRRLDSSQPNQSLLINLPKDHSQRLGLSGLQITIIDYTLSRANLGSSTEPEIIFDPMNHLPENHDLNDPTLDAESKIQFFTYDKCRRYAEAQARNDKSSEFNNKVDKWSHYTPKTNIFWLNSLLSILILRGGTTRKNILPKSNKHSRNVQSDLWNTLDRISTRIHVDNWDEIPTSAQALLELGLKEKWLSNEDLGLLQDQIENDL